MENNLFNNPSLLNAFISSANDENKKIKEATEEILKKYFIRSNIKNGEYYYEGRGKKEFYNIKVGKINEFRDEVVNLGKEHTRVNIKMIDKRSKDIKLTIAKYYGHMAEDLNMTIFKLIDNIYTGKYKGKLELFTDESLKCIVNRLYDATNEITDEKEKKEILNATRVSFKMIEEEMDEKVTEDYKNSNYINIRKKNLGNLKTILLVYLGCEIIMEIDPSWLKFYEK